MTHQSMVIAEGWKLRWLQGPESVPKDIREGIFAATVPGCVHTDLLSAGRIPDPYFDRNERDIQWIGQSDWCYETSFEHPSNGKPSTCAELSFEGLDTAARVELNGEILGEHENMHVPVTWDCGKLLRKGENQLKVFFQSPQRIAEERGNQFQGYPFSGAGDNIQVPHNMMRKMACNFGWDWGPVLLTAGIWKPVRLRIWNQAKLQTTRPQILIADSKQVSLQLDVSWESLAGCQPLTCEVKILAPSGRSWNRKFIIPQPETNGGMAIPFHWENPELWWPVGLGNQPRHDITVRLLDQNGECLDEDRFQFAIRSSRLVTEPDTDGSAFAFQINGTPVFCRGANWIPDDCFITRVTRERYRERIQQAVDGNMNMLRVWGGGIYESEDFYDLCDELGVMVWQDFCCSCACYPENGPFPAWFEAEARHHVARLSRHGSMVLWCGNNENQMGFHNWNWIPKLDGKKWGETYYLKTFPEVIQELNPSTPYWAGSPWSGSESIKPNEDNHGDQHIWRPWNFQDYLTYRDFHPRFVSEFGFMGSPTPTAWTRSVPEQNRQPLSESVRFHQRCKDGNQKLRSRLLEHFEWTDNFEDWVYLTQLNQARALSCGVEWYRSLHPRCMGTLIWQLNDCWPVSSWSLIDGYGLLKPAWYAARRFFAPRLITLQPHLRGIALHASNLEMEPWATSLRIRKMNFKGETLETMEQALQVRANGTEQILSLPRSMLTTTDPYHEMILAEADGYRAWWFFERDKDLYYLDPQFQGKLDRNGNEYCLTLTCENLARDVVLNVDWLCEGVKVSDQLLTLLPGEEGKFYFQCSKSLTVDELLKKPVLQCANYHGCFR